MATSKTGTEHSEAGRPVTRVHLSGKLTIARAKEIKQELEEAISPGQEIVVELTDVNAVDLSFIQLLWAARREADVSQARLRLELPLPESFRRELVRAGFFRDLDLVPTEDGEAIWSAGWDRSL